ncbi:hypothetical protein DFJ73DRAFT_761819 [Zopfochytrium polystomum]|nr:hypothetical protein DFJ73DRAFT_761819 [Zopfochytrium polystomum]
MDPKLNIASSGTSVDASDSAPAASSIEAGSVTAKRPGVENDPCAPKSRAVVPVRGLPTSGRPWKSVQTKRHTAMKPKSLKKGWKTHQEERRKAEIVKKMEREMKDEVNAAKEERRKKAEEKKKRKEENMRKAEIVQHVSAAKVKRMSKKQLRGIRLVPGTQASSTNAK